MDKKRYLVLYESHDKRPYFHPLNKEAVNFIANQWGYNRNDIFTHILHKGEFIRAFQLGKLSKSDIFTRKILNLFYYE